MKNKKILILSMFFYVTLIVTIGYISHSSLAIYKDSGTGALKTDTAVWNVSAISSNTTIDLTAGSTTTYSFTVNNESDVAVIYSIEISNLPTGIQVKLDNGDYISESSNKIIIQAAGELGYSGTTQKTHTLTFNTPLSSDEVNNQPVNIDVIFSQKIN